MTYINIPTAQLEHEAFLDATDEQNGIWLKLMRYCCSMENGGRIPAAKSWARNKIMIVLRVDSQQLTKTCPLWKWIGEDLLVEFYPKAKEAEVQGKRKIAKHANKARWRNPSSDPSSDPSSESGREEKRREENRREGKAPSPPDERQSIPETRSTEFGVEIPTDEAIVAFAKSWPGDIQRGIPAGITEAWALGWIAWRRSDPRPFPKDWQDDMVRRFRADWVSGHRNARPTSSAAQAGSRPVSQGQIWHEIRELEALIASHPGNPENGVGSLARKQAEFPNWQKKVAELAALKRSQNGSSKTQEEACA